MEMKKQKSYHASPIYHESSVELNGTTFHLTPTVQYNSQLLKSCVSSSMHVCLIGPPSSGKNTLIKILAEGKPYYQVIVDNSVDAKSLLGTYVCGDCPSEFVWRPGVLTTAAMYGGWVVFQQLQDTPLEILALLQSIITTRTLHIPQKAEEIPLHKDFKLIGTANLESEMPYADFITEKWLCLRIDPIPREEFQSWHSLPGLVSQWFNAMQATKGRRLYLSDWMKLAKRVILQIQDIYGSAGVQGEYLTEHFKQKLVQECLDTLPRNLDRALATLSEETGISVNQLNSLLSSKPNYQLKDTTIKVGRSPAVDRSPVQVNIALPPYTLRILEKILVSVAMDEAVLLVGETGCGKTTVVQMLAKLMGVPLIVHNLSQMSDSSDIIGGFKPLDLKFLLERISQDFWNILPDYMPNSGTVIAEFKGTYVKNPDQIVPLIKKTLKEIDQPSDIRISTLVSQVERYEKASRSSFVFDFIEGSLVKAVREGAWILLEEINLANADILERLHCLLSGDSLTLTEIGSNKQVPRHPNFRLFACMNPGTQIGKKDLAYNLRVKFTELIIQDITDAVDITVIAESYLQAPKQLIEQIVQFFQKLIDLSKRGLLEDGKSRPPKFSLRNLCRAMRYTSNFQQQFGLRTALYNGLYVFFVMQLASGSQQTVLKLLKDMKLVPSPGAPQSSIPGNCIDLFGYGIEKGDLPCTDSGYILTATVRKHVANIARVIVDSRYAVLLEGPTSCGKTSMVEYIASVTGHKFVRINNHQHTDIEEYVGSYAADETGKLVFKEGVLVEALRYGHFLVLDELNLAPSEVLEALNRLLDDNRELLIVETQTVITPHPHFRLFATQNPAATYAGRKELSAAFRNRFVEYYMEELPDSELETIVSEKGRIAPSYAKVLIKIMKDLQRRRTRSQVLLGREGFITIRSLLKIAGREPMGYQELAEAAYMVLGESLRTEDEREIIRSVIESNCRSSKLDMVSYYNSYHKTHVPSLFASKISWNQNMKRLFTLLDLCIKSNEPVILVGETGCGKTTICSVISEYYERSMRTVNCHLHTEASDFLGGLRPIRGRAALQAKAAELLNLPLEMPLTQMIQHYHDLDMATEELDEIMTRLATFFEWANGPLIEAMIEGDVFLIDEISLADESVLERLNSVLEPSRQLLLSEKGGLCSETITAADSFKILATMNPGGDYGKKELSLAMKNRFTEIWVELCPSDISQLIEQRVTPQLAAKMNEFLNWYPKQYSLRDVVIWCEFIQSQLESLGEEQAYYQGAGLVFLDACDEDLKNSAAKFFEESQNISEFIELSVVDDDQQIGIPPFFLEKLSPCQLAYSFSSATVLDNLFRLLRALQTSKPIMLEGAPGVGKTSIVESLAAYTGRQITRINLSEETDLIDLLGCDLPQENTYEWVDGVLLGAIRRGDWVILDELNLCSQAVLEGLNAILDHRQTVFIPEIGQSITCPATFRLFAAQNPSIDGSGRKNLPRSFLNRFTRIHMKTMTQEDLITIARDLYPEVKDIEQRVAFNSAMQAAFGIKWEFNLRDILRWVGGADPETLYYFRMRNEVDRNKVTSMFKEIFGRQMDIQHPSVRVTPELITIGRAQIPNNGQKTSMMLLPSHVPVLEQMLLTNHPVILTGDSSTGKRSLVRLVSDLTEKVLIEYNLSPGSDLGDLLGSFEQTESGEFAWVESSLVQAARQGHWVLLRHANLCLASVLDRLNSLLEPGGSLLIAERGQVGNADYIITPHEGFRVFLTYNPRYGEVSRALRNRCVELSLSQVGTYGDYTRLSGTMISREGYETVKHLGLATWAKWKDLRAQIPPQVILGDLAPPEQLKYPAIVPFSEHLNAPLQTMNDAWEALLDLYSRPKEMLLAFLEDSCLADCENRSLIVNWESFPRMYSLFKVSDDLYYQSLNPKVRVDIAEKHYYLACAVEDRHQTRTYGEVEWQCLYTTSGFVQQRLRGTHNTNAEVWKRRARQMTGIQWITYESQTLPADTRPWVSFNDEYGSKVSLPLVNSKDAYALCQQLDGADIVRPFLARTAKSLVTQVLQGDFSALRKLAIAPYLPPQYKALVDLWAVESPTCTKSIVYGTFLLLSDNNIPDYNQLIESVRETTLLQLPKIWWALQTVLEWDVPDTSFSLSVDYFDSWKHCLRTPSQSLIEIAFEVYQIYWNPESDYAVLWKQLLEHYEKISYILQSNLEIRQSIDEYFDGIVLENYLTVHYKQRIETLTDKMAKLSEVIPQRHNSWQQISAALGRLMSPDELATRINDQSPDSQKHILGLLTTQIEFLSSMGMTDYRDILQPLIESLGLMRFTIRQQVDSNDFPRSLETLRDIKERAFAEHFVGRFDAVDMYADNVSNFFKRQQELQEVGDKKFTIRAQKFSDLHTIHTIGDKPAEFDTEAMEKVFPSYTHTLWQVKTKIGNEELWDLWLDWHFSCGRRAEDIYGRYMAMDCPWQPRARWYLSRLEFSVDGNQTQEDSQNNDFYSDSNPQEVRLLYIPLSNLLVAVSDLIKEWPENEILQETAQIAHKNLSFPVLDTSLGEAVAGVTRLLNKCQEWEDYANVKTSLKEFTAPMYSLVRRWREMELKSWEKLLENVRETYIKADVPLWGRLYLALENSSASEIASILDEYVISSTIGHFQFRLDNMSLLQKFHPDLPLTHMISLYTSLDFDSFYKTKVSDVEDKIREQIRITKFNFTNFHSLHGSVEKAKKAIYAQVSHYNEILHTPVNDWLKSRRKEYTKNILEEAIAVPESQDGNRAEQMVSEIFERIETLRNEGKVGDKQNAVQELFSRLENEGFSHFYQSRSDVVFYETPQIADPANQSLSDAEKYFYKSTDMLGCLRAAESSSLASEIRERCIGFSYSLTYHISDLRTSIANAMDTAKLLTSAASGIITDPTLVYQLSERRTSLKNDFWKLVQECLVEGRTIPTYPTLDTPWFTMEQLNQLQEVVTDLAGVAYKNNATAIFNYAQVTVEQTNLSGISQQYISIISSPFENLENYTPESLQAANLDFSNYLEQAIDWYRSLAKMLYVLLNTFNSIFANGFCKAPDEDDEEGEGEEEETEMHAGTGLDEGTGMKDVTDELIDQEQFGSEEKNAEQQEAEKQKEEEVNMDVQYDFDGREENVSGSDADAEEQGEGSAEGNERALSDIEAEFGDENEGEIRPNEQVETQTSGYQPKDEEGKQQETEDFDIPQNQEPDEINELGEEQETVELDKPATPDPQEEENQEDTQEPAEDKEGMNDEKELDGEESQPNPDAMEEASDQEPQQPPELTSREFQDYKNEAYGRSDITPNTEKMKGQDENQSDQTGAAVADILTQLKGDWNTKQRTGKSDLGRNQAETLPADQALDVDVIDEQGDKADESVTHQFDAGADTTAIAPSNEQSVPTETEAELREKQEEEKRSNEATQDQTERKPDSTNEIEKPKIEPDYIMYEFQAAQNPLAHTGTPDLEDLDDLPPETTADLTKTYGNLQTLKDTWTSEKQQEGKQLWNQYSELVQPLAHQLCEQLRIVLDPTKASGFKGDYKSGKRLNIKKVISYIASNFLKDKIWLRRTKLTQRDYNIHIAIDDSFSMQQHGLGQFALQGFATMIETFRKLEVGKLAISAIRDGMSLLHDFGEALTTKSAEFAVSQFTFQYGREHGSDENFPQFMSDCTSYLQQYQGNLNLVVIISDGRLNKAKVRPWVRLNEQTLFLFIILDNPESSILKMQSTVFDQGVKLYPYLSDFPFEHYIVLESASCLVDVLSDVIKQWFASFN